MRWLPTDDVLVAIVTLVADLIGDPTFVQSASRYTSLARRHPSNLATIYLSLVYILLLLLCRLLLKLFDGLLSRIYKIAVALGFHISTSDILFR